MIVAVVEPAAVTAIAAIGNAEHAVHGAHRTADTGADRAANHSADWTGGTAAFIRALLRAANDALGMPDVRNREQGESKGCARKMEFCGRAGGERRCHDLHLNS